MLQTHEVGKLFAVMQAEYGHRWAHKADAVPVWQEKLRGYNGDQVMSAAAKAPDVYPDFPPTVGQFRQLLDMSRPRPTTYLPAPRQSSAVTLANKILLQVLRDVGGVDRLCLLNLTKLKNALVEDFPERWGRENKRDAYRQLTALALDHDESQRAKELEQAQAGFRVRAGIPGAA